MQLTYSVFYPASAFFSGTQGFQGSLRIAYSDGLAHLRAGLLDIGLTLSTMADAEIITEPLWRDPIVVILPANHAFARWRKIALKDIASEPLVLCHPHCSSGSYAQLDSLLRTAIPRPTVVEYAVSAAASITLVASGYGIGFMGAAEAAMLQ